MQNELAKLKVKLPMNASDGLIVLAEWTNTSLRVAGNKMTEWSRFKEEKNSKLKQKQRTIIDSAALLLLSVIFQQFEHQIF